MIRQPRGPLTAAFIGLWLAPMTGGSASAETPEVSSGGAISLGNRGWSAAETTGVAPATELGSELEFSARAGFASDYIYRGTTMNNREPAAGAAFEASFSSLYAGGTIATVTLPTHMARDHKICRSAFC